MTPPLSGLRILDLSHVLAGPYASHILGMLGAEVIKIERPGIGDSTRDLSLRPELQGLSAGFVAANAGKRSLAVDIGKPEGRRIVERLAETADVFVENFRPGKIAALGLGPDRLAEINPRLVYCSISAWGQQGAMAPRGGYDHVMQAATGMMMLQGDDENAPPTKVGFPVIDMATGMMGALAVLAAVLRRRNGGTEKIHLDVSMADAALFLMAPMAIHYLIEGQAPRRVGNVGFAASPGGGVFRTADGWLSTAANTLGQFDALCRVIGHPEYSSAPDFLTQRPAKPGAMLRNLATPRLTAALKDAFLGRTSEAWEDALSAAAVPVTAIRSLPQYLDGRYRETGGVSVGVPQPSGDPWEILSAGFRWNGTAAGSGRPAAKLGQDNAAILAEAGYGEREIAALREQGILG